MLTTAKEIGNTGTVTAKSVTGFDSSMLNGGRTATSICLAVFLRLSHACSLFGRSVWEALRLPVSVEPGLSTRTLCPFCV